MKFTHLLIVIFLILGTVVEVQGQAATTVQAPSPEATNFTEVWAYLMKGEEAFLKPNMGITDLAYFSARISNRGELFGMPDISKIQGFPGRKHLVVAEVSNTALLHFILNPEYPIRERLIQQIVEAAKVWDGLQIDFELVASTDAENFRSFIRTLRERLPSTILSIALPARTRHVEDAFAYPPLIPLVDKIVLMAYDEHWSGSNPGPVATMAWGSRVAEYVLRTMGPTKAVMGIPFYGRAWADKTPGGAYKHSTATRKVQDFNITIQRDQEGITWFRWTETINLIMHIDDAVSLQKRLTLYGGLGVRNIGFWRLGQEDPEVWNITQLKR